LSYRRSAKLLFDVALDNLSRANRKKIVDLRDTYDRIIRKILRRGMDTGCFRNIDEKIAGFMLASMITRTRIWYHPKKGISVSDLADFIFEFALNGLRLEKLNGTSKTPPKEKMNLADFLTDTANRIPDHVAIRFEGEAITFAEMNRRVDALANGLAGLGLTPEDVCVLMMPNSINWALVYYALAKLGAVVVPVNFLYRQREIEYIFRDAGARAFVGHSDYLKDAVPVLDSLPLIHIRIAEGENLPAEFTPLKELFDEGRDFQTYETKADDPLCVIYTSGTTGEPKVPC